MTHTHTEIPQLVLASTSIYRRELLLRLGLPFVTVDPSVDESPEPGEEAQAQALRLAKEKAYSVADQFVDALIIGSDQVAQAEGVTYGKPGNHERAVNQLSMLSGKQVDFFTALCVYDTRCNESHCANVRTQVVFRDLSQTEIENYVRLEKPYHCAGSAKSEGLGIALLSAIHTQDPTALIGLPLVSLVSLLKLAGLHVLDM